MIKEYLHGFCTPRKRYRLWLFCESWNLVFGEEKNSLPGSTGKQKTGCWNSWRSFYVLRVVRFLRGTAGCPAWIFRDNASRQRESPFEVWKTFLWMTKGRGFKSIKKTLFPAREYLLVTGICEPLLRAGVARVELPFHKRSWLVRYGGSSWKTSGTSPWSENFWPFSIVSIHSMFTVAFWTEGWVNISQHIYAGTMRRSSSFGWVLPSRLWSTCTTRSTSPRCCRMI